MKDLFIPGYLLVFLLCTQQTFAQQPDLNWFFGSSKAGLTFDTIQNSILSNNVKNENFGREGSVTVSDPTNGKLLFFTDGDRVYDSEFKLVASGLGGQTSTSQAVSVCASPCNPNKYLIFSSNAYLEGFELFPGKLQYTEVNIDDDSIFIDQTNRNIILDDAVSEVKTIIHDAESNGYWLVGLKSQSSTVYVYGIDCSGLSEPKYYDLSSAYDSIYYPTVFKYSPIRKQIVLTSIGGGVGLIDFDNKTGQIISYNKIDAYQDIRAYDAEWSMDGSNLYISKFSTAALFQYNFDLDEITPLYFSFANGGGLQTGPDGYIYHIPDGPEGEFLNRIEQPNLQGLACNYVQEAYDVGLAYSSFKLPEPVTRYNEQNCISLDKSFKELEVCSGERTTVSLSIINNSCDTLHDAIFLDHLSPFGIIADSTNYPAGNILIGDKKGDTSILITGINIVPGVTNFNFEVELFSLETQTFSNQAALIIEQVGVDTILSDNPLTTSEIDSTTITIINEVPIIFPVTDSLLCAEDTLRINLKDSYEIIEWQDGSSESSVVAENEGLYFVAVEDKCGTYQDSITITLIDCDCEHFIPNAFSPNGDNINDEHQVHLTNFVDYHLMIYNRWGEKVFESFDPLKQWDGRFNGELLSSDVFGYSLQYVCAIDNRIVQVNGNITLIR